MAKMITSMSEDYSRWYIDIVTNAELADYSPVKGCMVIRPNGYALWENIQKTLDRMFKETGHVNAYFPLLIPESFMRKEAEHVEGFAPECAVVTHGGGKKLEESLYIRPTSETIIWSMYSKWINSYRDLPLLINQWANVLRWEMRTRLFLRTTEFLWQEGHTAHATAEEAEEETVRMIDIYREFCEKCLAIPVLKGKKTNKEKFAGAVHTYSIEAMMQDKKALQAGTSHNLGQNFAKAFNVTYLDSSGERKLVWATSWGVSTRLIGALIMAHSDDNGLVVPPKIAHRDCVIIPIWKREEDRGRVLDYSSKIYSALKKNGINAIYDDSDQYKPGWKYAQYEMLGIPLRIEVGPREVDQAKAVIVRRDNRAKALCDVENIIQSVAEAGTAMQEAMYLKAKNMLESNTREVETLKELEKQIEDGGFFRVSWCGERECEDVFQDRMKATIRLIDSDYDAGRCIICGKKSRNTVIVARSY